MGIGSRKRQEQGGKTSLVWLPTLLTDAAFRQKIVSKVAPKDQEKFVFNAKLAGFTGIIRYFTKQFVHIDIRQTPYEGFVS